MTSATTRRSLTEWSARQRVTGLLDHRLLVRSAAAQSVAADTALCKIHIGTDQAMLPQRIHGQGPAQQLHLALPVATPQEDQSPLRVGLQVQTPTPREGTAPRRRLDPRGRTVPMGRHIPGRLRLQRLQGRVLEARPDLGLPQAVEALDGRLE